MPGGSRLTLGSHCTNVSPGKTVVLDNLKLFLKLYYRPLAAMSSLIDEGSWLFGALAVAGTSLVFQAAMAGTLRESLQPSRSAVSNPAADGADETRLLLSISRGLVSASPLASVTTVAGLALLYVPATLLVMVLLERRNSFNVALQRHYLPLLTCTFMSWAAAHLPFALVALALGGALSGGLALALWALAGATFGVLMLCALRTVSGSTMPVALGTIGLSWLSLLLRSYLLVLASPFAFLFVYSYLRSEFGDLASIFRSQQSFRRYLEAATLNPRDADAHYQLGLIFQRRRRYREAITRFTEATQIDPREVDAHFQLGRIAMEQKRFPDAIESFEAVLSRDDKHAQSEVLRDVGSAYGAAGRLDKAREALERYVERRPYDPEGLYQLGLVLAELGDKDGARAALERCVEAVVTMPPHRRREVRRWRDLALSRLKALTV